MNEDRPIILKEGQAVVFAPAGNKSLMVSAAVIDGKLSVSQIDPKGKNFSVTWNDTHSWTTASTDSEPGQSTTTIDKDGDGTPDIRAIIKDGATTRFRLEDPKWIEIK